MLASLSRWVREGPVSGMIPTRFRGPLERLTVATAYRSGSTPYGVAVRSDSPAAGLLFGGDIALHRWSPGTGPETLLDGLRQIALGAGALVANLESQLTARTEPAGTTGSSLRADPAALDALRFVGVSAVTCANNHSLDFGAGALRESVDLLRSAGIRVSGVRHRGASDPVVFDAGPVRVGMLAYTDDWRPAGAAIPDPAPVPHEPDVVRADIAALRSSVDLVVVQLHWGYEWAMYPLRRYRDLARSYADAGADVVVCHHAHVPMGLEARGTSVIAHGLGNLYFGPPGRDRHPFRNLSFLLRVSASRKGVVSAEAVPVATDESGRVGPANAEAAAGLGGALRILSRRLGDDRYVDRVERALLSEAGGRLFRDMVRRLREGDAAGLAERRLFLRTPRQRILTGALREHGSAWAAAGQWLDSAREAEVTMTPELSRLDHQVGRLLDRVRLIGRIP